MSFEVWQACIFTFWYDAGIHERGQRKIGQYKEGYDPLKRRNPWISEEIILASKKKYNYGFSVTDELWRTKFGYKWKG